MGRINSAVRRHSRSYRKYPAEKGNVIPGAAIAAALMPPLCTTGYGLATKQPGFILGAFYLFTINILFVMLSAAFVTKLLGASSHKARDPKRQKRVKKLVTVITVLTVIPSIMIGALRVYQTVVAQNFTAYINSEFAFPDTQVVKSDIDMRSREVSVSLVGMQIPNA